MGPGTRSGSGALRRLLGLLALAALPLAVLGVFFVLPVIGMVGRGFVVDGETDVRAVLDVLARPRVHRVLWFTVWSSTVATVVAVLLGLPAAYALHRLHWPGRRVVRAALLVPFVLPTVVVGVAFRQLLGESGPVVALTGGRVDLDGTATGIVAGLVFFNVAVVIRGVGAAWESLDTRPGEAAAVLGASPAQVFRTVTWPALRPAVVSSASVVFLFCATAFGVVLTLGGLRYSSVETEIYLLTTELLDLQAAAALSLLQLVAVVALLVVAGRLRAVPDPTLARSTAPPRRPRRSDVPQLAATTLLLVLVAAPVVTLVVGSLRVDGAWSLVYYRALGGAGEDSALPVPAAEALVTSLRTAVDATWMALLLGGLVGVVLTRRSRSRSERRFRSVLDGFFMLPLGVSAVTLGFGFLITLDSPPLDLRESPVLVPLAQALVALPLVVRTLVPVLAGVDDRQRQAAASLGAGPLRAAVTVDLPVVWRPLLAAAGFAFAVSLGEFGATSFLARPDRPTLPVVIFRLISRPGELQLRHRPGRLGGAGRHDRPGRAGRRAAAGPVPRSVLMLSLTDVSVAYDGEPALHRVSLDLPDGQVLAVLGPSGCGKSTLLRAVAGLEPSSGTIAWDGQDLARVPTHKRGFALMFQDGQLFTHLSVGRNVGYALRLRRTPGAARRVEELLELVGLAGYADRLPGTLSGGERQRVALARALAVQPRLLLLDEPLSALDAGLRERLAGDLRDILRRAGTTALMVTHDHDEAFTVADRLAVLQDGHLVQEGPIEAVWREPADTDTALFLGYARVLEGPAAVRVLAAAGPDLPPGAGVAVRRSALQVDPSGPLGGQVRTLRATPELQRLVVDVDGVGECDAVASLDRRIGPGDRVALRVDATRLAVLPGLPERG